MSPFLQLEVTPEFIGVMLIVIGVILLIVELATPGFFIAIPGSILLVIGLIMYFIPWVWETPWGIAIAIVVSVSMSALVLQIYKKLGRGHKVLTPSVGTMSGKSGLVVEDVIPNDLSGKVRIGSEIWSATSNEPIPKGEKVVVVKGEGVHLVVEKKEKEGDTK